MLENKSKIRTRNLKIILFYDVIEGFFFKTLANNGVEVRSSLKRYSDDKDKAMSKDISKNIYGITKSSTLLWEISASKKKSKTVTDCALELQEADAS